MYVGYGHRLALKRGKKTSLGQAKKVNLCEVESGLNAGKEVGVLAEPLCDKQ